LRSRAPHYRQNPAWTNSAITGHWGRIVKRARELDSEHLAPAQMPSSSVIAREALEYGEGKYGVVFPTGIPGTVAKITSDAMEAEFIQAAMKMASKDGWPTGIVKFDAIYLMDGSHVVKMAGGWAQRRPMFFMWREEAYEVGDIAAEHLQLKQATDEPEAAFVRRRRIEMTIDRLRQCKTVGQEARAMVESARSDSAQSGSDREIRTLLEKAQSRRDWAVNNFDMDWLDDPEFYENYDVDGPKHLAILRAAYEVVAKSISRIEVCPEAGKAMHHYCTRGIMLPDIHMNNIGVVERKADRIQVITDAGQAIFFDPDHKFGTIPRL